MDNCFGLLMINNFLFLFFKGKIIVDRCGMCKNCGETVDHLLLHRVVAREFLLRALSPKII